MITTHAEYAVAHHAYPLHLSRVRGQDIIQLFHIKVRVDRFTGRTGQAYGVDDTVVIQRIAHHHGLLTE